jgi:hypothetical protein
MKTEPSGKPLSPDVQSHVQTAVTNLEKALQALQGGYASADVHTAVGRTASASRALRRACEALKADSNQGRA